MSTFIKSETESDQSMINLAGRERFMEALTHFFMCMFLVFVFAVAQGFRFGFHQQDYGLLALGSAVSAICGFVYGVSGIARANARNRWLAIQINDRIETGSLVVSINANPLRDFQT